MANFKSAILTTGSYTKTGTAQVPLIEAVDVSNEDRLSFNFYNAGSSADVVKVYGKLGDSAGTLALASDMWTQIGDDITVSGTSSSLKSIATTGLSLVGVTVTPGAGSNTISHAMLRQA
tara:strand:+ start:958 stop:1314 length:357 start_codon:yes stop_codon:yes gene_type:complete